MRKKTTATSNTEAIKAVKEKLAKIFAGQLKMYAMDIASDRSGCQRRSMPAAAKLDKPADEKGANRQSESGKAEGRGDGRATGTSPL